MYEGTPNPPPPDPPSSHKDTAWRFWGLPEIITLILGHGSSSSRFPPCQHKSARPHQIHSPAPERLCRMCWNHLILLGLYGTIDCSHSFREKWPQPLFQKVGGCVLWPPVDWGITQLPARLSAPDQVCLRKADGSICLGWKSRRNCVSSTFWVISCPSLCPEETFARYWIKQHVSGKFHRYFWSFA